MSLKSTLKWPLNLFLNMIQPELTFSITSAIVVVLGIFICRFLTSSITKPIRKSVTFSQQLAKGDLTAENDIEQNDEIGAIGKSTPGNTQSGGLAFL